MRGDKCSNKTNAGLSRSGVLHTKITHNIKSLIILVVQRY